MIEKLGWYKDQWLDIDRIFIAANNRGLKFADGLFETIFFDLSLPIRLDRPPFKIKPNNFFLGFFK